MANLKVKALRGDKAHDLYWCEIHQEIELF